MRAGLIRGIKIRGEFVICSMKGYLLLLRLWLRLAFNIAGMQVLAECCRLQVLLDQLDKKRHNKIIPLRFVSQTLVPNGQPVLIILLSPKGTNVNTIAIMSQLMST